MSGISNQSPAVLKNANGASKIGRGASTVDADLTAAEAAIVDNAAAVVDLNGDMLERVNPLAQAVRVAMTRGASATTGIRVQNNANSQPGNYDFGVTIKAAVEDFFYNVGPDSYNGWMMGSRQSADDQWFVGNLQNGKMKAEARVGGVVIYSVEVDISSSVGAATNGKSMMMSCFIKRETVLADGEFKVLLNGVNIGSVAIPAAATVDISNTGNFEFMGYNGDRLPCDWIQTLFHNRFYSDAEVLSLYNAGPALADIGARQAAVYASDYSAGVDGFASIDGGSIVVTGNVDGVGGEGDWCRAERSGSSGGLRAVRVGCYIPDKINQTVVRVHNGHSSALNIGVTNNSGALRDGFFAAESVPAGESRDYVFEGNAPVSTSMTVGCFSSVVAGATIASVPSGAKIYWKLVTTRQTGITGQWDAKDAQSNTGQILDTSGNGDHAILPTSGATVFPRLRRAAVISEHNWNGTGEAQYLSLFNQAVLPADAYIERIIAVVTGDPQHGTLGDGVDDDRYCKLAENLPLIEGVNTLAINQRVSDGANGKLLWTPAFSGTCAIKFIVEYLVMGV